MDENGWKCLKFFLCLCLSTPVALFMTEHRYHNYVLKYKAFDILIVFF